MTDYDTMKIFWEIHSDLPREGPGTAESTRKAFSMIPDLPEAPDILDVGCGPGMQTLDLAALTKGKITAVDNHQAFLDDLRKRAAEQGLSKQIEIMNGDMNALPFAQKSFDLIWAEGSIFIMGFEKGLRAWRPLLKDGGYVAVTDAAWLRPDVPAEVKKFWECYPGMQDVAANVKAVERAGYRLIGHFTLPDEAWWNDYYHPMEKKLALLREIHKDDKEALKYLTVEQVEIEMFRKYSKYYGYVFFVMQTA
jgi:ubiquinone/menaquinone biosynthesis C-methylase UbiE